MFLRGPHTVSPRALMFTLFVAVLGLATLEIPLNAQLCTGTSPPCVLTAGYAGPATDANFNSRQAVNPYETTLSPTLLLSSRAGTLYEVDDSASALPHGATSNPIMAQPLYVKGITTTLGSCTGCNMVIAVTLNGTVFAWIADGTGAGNLLWSRQGTPSSGQGNAGNALWYDDCGGTGSAPAQRVSTLQFQGIVSTPVIDASGSAPNVSDVVLHEQQQPARMVVSRDQPPERSRRGIEEHPDRCPRPQLFGLLELFGGLAAAAACAARG
jgi:hypothetical protein